MKMRRAFSWLAVVLVTLVSPGALAQAPAPSDEVVKAYSEYICFIMFEVTHEALTPELQQECKTEASKQILDFYPKLSDAERQELDQMPAQWAGVQAEWAKIDEAERNKYRAQWAKELQDEMKNAQ